MFELYITLFFRNKTLFKKKNKFSNLNANLKRELPFLSFSTLNFQKLFLVPQLNRIQLIPNTRESYLTHFHDKASLIAKLDSIYSSTMWAQWMQGNKCKLNTQILDTLQFFSRPSIIDQGYPYPIDEVDKNNRNLVAKVDDLGPYTLFHKTIYMLEMLLMLFHNYTPSGIIGYTYQVCDKRDVAKHLVKTNLD